MDGELWGASGRCAEHSGTGSRHALQVGLKSESVQIHGNCRSTRRKGVSPLRDSFADYFRRYDALLCPVTPLPATKPGLNDLVVDGQTMSPFHVMSATSPFSLTGMPALSMRFGTSHEGLPIGVQIVSSWLAESTVLVSPCSSKG